MKWHSHQTIIRLSLDPGSGVIIEIGQLCLTAEQFLQISMFVKAVTRDRQTASKSQILGHLKQRDSRMTTVYWRWNLFSMSLMTKLTLTLTLNDPHDAFFEVGLEPEKLTASKLLLSPFRSIWCRGCTAHNLSKFESHESHHWWSPKVCGLEAAWRTPSHFLSWILFFFFDKHCFDLW